MSFGKHLKNPLSSGPVSLRLLDSIFKVGSSDLDLIKILKLWMRWSVFSMSTILAILSGLRWATSFYEQDNNRSFTVGEVLQSFIDHHGRHFAVFAAHSLPLHSA